MDGLMIAVIAIAWVGWTRAMYREARAEARRGRAVRSAHTWADLYENTRRTNG